jgi:hypothetical protein
MTIKEALELVTRAQQDYLAYVAECDAEGQEPLSWEEWTGEETAMARKQRFQDVWLERYREDTQDLY